MKKSRKILFISILAICILAINIGVYLQFFRSEKKEQEGRELILQQAIQEFDTIFKNECDLQNNNVLNTIKNEEGKQLIYTSNKKTEIKQGEYNISVNIPRININNNIIQEYNKKINSIFKSKLDNILLYKQSNTIYTVEYQAYLNDNILSLIIKATLKEGNNPQRLIIQTYNYDINTNKEVNLKDLLQTRDITEDKVYQTIKERIEEENKQSEELKQIIGQNIYTRDINSNIYKLENTNTFFLGKDNILYILYPYGNANYTSELDIITF